MVCQWCCTLHMVSLLLVFYLKEIHRIITVKEINFRLLIIPELIWLMKRVYIQAILGEIHSSRRKRFHFHKERLPVWLMIVQLISFNYEYLYLYNAYLSNQTPFEVKIPVLMKKPFAQCSHLFSFALSQYSWQSANTSRGVVGIPKQPV